MADFNLVEGREYTINVTIRNKSAAGGVPVAASLPVTIYGEAGGWPFINFQEIVSFAAGQLLTISQVFNAPPLSWGTSGTLTGKVFNPDGSQVLGIGVKSVAIGAADNPPVTPPPTTPLVINLGISGYDVEPGAIEVYTIDNIDLINISVDEAMLRTPIQVSQLRGVKMLYKHLIPLIPTDWFGVGSNPHEVYWTLTFEPEFEAGYWRDWYDEGSGESGTEWYEPAFPGFRLIQSMTASNTSPLVTNQPAPGTSFKLPIEAEYFGGEKMLPGIYSGVFRLWWLSPAGAGFGDRYNKYWKIKNMMKVV